MVSKSLLHHSYHTALNIISTQFAYILKIAAWLVWGQTAKDSKVLKIPWCHLLSNLNIHLDCFQSGGNTCEALPSKILNRLKCSICVKVILKFVRVSLEQNIKNPKQTYYQCQVGFIQLPKLKPENCTRSWGFTWIRHRMYEIISRSSVPSSVTKLW